MKVPTTATIAAAAMLTLTACGDGADVIDDGAGPDATTEGSDDATDDVMDDGADDDGADDDGADDDGADGGNTVTIVDNDFEDGDLEVSVGDTVEWVHEGDAPHNVTFDDEASDTLESGDTFSVTFDETGGFDYSCTFHPGMDGTITVS